MTSVRPAAVDPKATYDEEEEEWVLEPSHSRDWTGVARRWREDGTLLSELTYSSGVAHTRRFFHSDGAIGGEEFRDEATGQLVRRCRYAPNGESDLEFPSGGLDQRIVKTEYRYGPHGYLSSFTGWDAQGTVISEEELDRALDGSTNQRSYASLEVAAAEWNEKGEAFYADINAHILAHFVDDESTDDDDDDIGHDDEGHDDDDDDDDHPMDQRGHMERFVLDALAEANEHGRGASFRETFSPSFEPFCDAVWEGLGQHVRKVCALEDGALATVGTRVFRVTLDAIEAQPGPVAFGASRDKRFFAKCGPEAVTIHEGWNGAVLRSFAYPTDYGPQLEGLLPPEAMAPLADPHTLGIHDVVVGNDGRFAVLACRHGIFILEEPRTHPLFPDPDLVKAALEDLESQEERDRYVIEVEDPRAAVSAQEEMLIISGQFGPCEPIRRAVALGRAAPDRALQLSIKYDDTWSSGPVGPTVFHSNGEHVVVSMVEHQPSFFGMGGGTESQVITAPASAALAAKDGLLDGYEGLVMLRSDEIQAACEFEDRFLVGMADCYLWLQDIDVNTQKFVFVGARGIVGVITSVDVSPDQKTIYVATDFGTVQRFATQDEPGRGFITNLALRDERRYLFLDTFEPMLW